MNELIFLSLFFGLPGIFGVILARRRGKNPVLWGLLSAIFPFFLVVLKLQYKPLNKSENSNPSTPTQPTP